MDHVVSTSAADVLAATAPLIADLAADLPSAVRYQRLLDRLRMLVPCDAVALLRLEGDVLVPEAVHGLGLDTLGRRFAVASHPRLQAILEGQGAVHFPADCDLPDPYDGLVQTPGGELEVHDCMGCALQVGGRVWGVLTVDALETRSFSAEHIRVLEMFATVAAATVAASARFHALQRSVEDERRMAEAHRLAAVPARQALVGQSPALAQLQAQIALVAPSDLTVLVTGETGVGKELVARAVHAGSSRADKVFISVNCAALPENLVESELFGHVRGAFSGAVADRQGKFAMADGGTLFLDEVGELPLAVQAKLLRVLQDGHIQRIGSDRELHADVRLVAATNRDLAAEVRARRFRADLYHRISVFPLLVPPLRERQQDVLLLAGRFIEENRRRLGVRGIRLSRQTSAALKAYDWPGNVRELEYLIARAALKTLGRREGHPSGIVTLEPVDLDLPAPPAAEGGAAAAASQGHEALPAPAADLRGAVDRFQRELIERALAEAGGNVAAGARALGLDRANLVRLARRLGIVAIGRPRGGADSG